MLMLAALHVFIVNQGASPLLTTLVSVVIGALLGFGGSLLIRRGEHGWQEERERSAQEWQTEQQRLAHEREVAWQEQRDRFARDVQFAMPLDEALIETQRRVWRELVPKGGSHWAYAHREWKKGWVRITPHLIDAELEDRYKAVGTILTALKLHFDEAEEDSSPHRMATRNVADKAILNARRAVTSFLRGAPLPAPCFPGSRETIELLNQGEPNPLAAEAPLRRWITEHEVR
jgi:hypothetical protein